MVSEMSRELIATDKNPYGGIKKKKKAYPNPPSPPPPPSQVCLSRRTLIILNKPSAAQLTIRKPCLLARGIHANPPHHRRLHVLPISAAAMDAGRRGCLPSQPFTIQTSQGIAALEGGSPARFGGHGTWGPSGLWAHLRRAFFGNGISPLRNCYSPAGVICGEPVSVVDGASPHRRRKRARVMMNV